MLYAKKSLYIYIWEEAYEAISNKTNETFILTLNAGLSVYLIYYNGFYRVILKDQIQKYSVNKINKQKAIKKTFPFYIP